MYYDESFLYWEAFTVTASEGFTTKSRKDDCVNAVQFACDGIQSYPDDAFLADGTPISCEEFADQVNALAPNTWQNDLPSTDCLDLTFDDCNQDLTGGTGKFNENEGCVGFDCNDPKRSISFAPPP